MRGDDHRGSRTGNALVRGRRRALPLLLLALSPLIGYGCSHAHVVPDRSNVDRIREVNEAVAGENGTISLLERGGPLSATNLSVAPDSVRYLDSRTMRRAAVATSRVDRFTVKDSGRGALEGLGLGFLAYGALVGTAAVLGGFAEGTGSGDDPITLGILPYWAAVALAPVPIVTILVGAAFGSKSVYIFGQWAPR